MEKAPAAWKRKWHLLSFLGVIWLFHAVNNCIFLFNTDTPPHYDCGYHLQLSINFYERLFKFSGWDYFASLLFSSSFYPPVAYTAAAPFYLVFGITEDAANLGNLLFLALLLWSTYEIGRLLVNPETGMLAAALVSFFPFVYGISRVYYVETALMAVTAFAVLRLIRTRSFEDRRQSIFFGLSVGLGMLTKWAFAFFLTVPVCWVVLCSAIQAIRAPGEERVTKVQAGGFDLGGAIVGLGFGALILALLTERPVLWVGPATLPLLVGAAFSTSSRAIRERLLNLVLSGVAAILVCYPWYIRTWDHISSIAKPFLDSGVTGQHAAWSLGSLAYFPFALESSQLGPVLFLGLLLAVFLFPWRSIRGFAVVGGWIVGGYLITSTIPYKDPRYISPYLPALALFMATAYLSIRSKAARRVVISLVFTGALWQFEMNTYELPLPAGNHFALSRFGHFYSFWNHGVYGTGREMGVNWPHRKIVEDFESACVKNRPDATEIAHLRCLIDLPNLHQGVFEFLARSERGPWQAVFDRDILPHAKEMNRTIDSDAILFANSAIPGDLYAVPLERKPFLFNAREDSFFRVRFPTQTVYELPEGASVTLAVFSCETTLGPNSRGSFAFSDAVRATRAALIRKEVGGRPSYGLQVDWESASATDAPHPATAFSVLAVSLDGTRGFPIRHSQTSEKTSWLQGTCEYDLQPEDLSGDAYQMALQVLDKDAGSPLPVDIPGLGVRDKVFLREVVDF
jgi:4-amino-4-deoxy-L-arabinose transferase-like glycosyltransferase